MKRIYNAFSKRPSEAYPVGSRVQEQYIKHINDDGLEEAIVSGRYDRQDIINASKDSVDIYTLINRFSNGDETALKRTQAFFADVSHMPTSLLESHRLYKSLEAKFDSLPIDIKNQFDDNFSNFVIEFGGNGIDGLMKKYNTFSNPKVDEVKEGEK